MIILYSQYFLFKNLAFQSEWILLILRVFLRIRKRASTKVFVFYFYFFGPAKLIIHLQWDLILIEGLRAALTPSKCLYNNITWETSQYQRKTCSISIILYKHSLATRSSVQFSHCITVSHYLKSRVSWHE